MSKGDNQDKAEGGQEPDPVGSSKHGQEFEIFQPKLVCGKASLTSSQQSETDLRASWAGFQWQRGR